jgi:desumoylating isopeptidase 1
MLADAQDLLRAVIGLASMSLLDGDHATARVAAASLAFNVAAANQVARAAKIPTHAVAEEVQIELVAAVVEALRAEESSKEAVAGLVMALGLSVYMAPMDGEVVDLCRALEVPEVIKGKQKLIEGAGAKEAVDILTKGLSAIS